MNLAILLDQFTSGNLFTSRSLYINGVFIKRFLMMMVELKEQGEYDLQYFSEYVNSIFRQILVYIDLFLLSKRKRYKETPEQVNGNYSCV